MTSKSTGAMQQFPSAGPSPAELGPGGFVLLYAEDFAVLPAVWPLRPARVVIGREPPADVIIPVNAISRVHAELVMERSGVTLRDLNSTNGTLVDGRRVKEARLETGQEVRFGNAIFKFVENSVEKYSNYRINGSVTAHSGRLSPALPSLVGGYQIDKLASDLLRVAKSELSVMLLGESGTGKEVVARQLH